MFDKLIVTERLLIRRIRKDDKEKIRNILMISEVSEKLGINESENSIEKLLNNMFKGVEYVIEEKPTQNVIGSIGIVNKSDNEGWIEVGYEIEKKLWGKGYGTEALQAFINYVFCDTDYKKIIALTFVDNYRSRCVLEKNKFIYKGVYHSKVVIGGMMQDFRIYILTK